MSLFLRGLAPIVTVVLCLFAPALAAAQDHGTGGAAFEAEPPPPSMASPGQWTGPEVPGAVAELLPDGTAAAPADAPEQVKQAIWAANSLQSLPYVYGGGHSRSFKGEGYDCSGTVSFALHAAGLLRMPLHSGAFMTWGLKGPGRWITVYTNPGHAYAVIAGLRLDTSVAGMSRLKGVSRKAFERGPRWRPMPRSPRGFRARHSLSF